MPPMIAAPFAIPQGKEQELDQEFELDIRVSSINDTPAVSTKLTHQQTCPGGTVCACPTIGHTGGCCYGA
jgi:hypothetical protein